MNQPIAPTQEPKEAPEMATVESTTPRHVVLIDNHDSFVYNLVDALAVAGFECTVYRNTVDPATVLAANPDVIVLSPGPAHPRDAGNMMKLIELTYGRVPLLGICLGFQALLDYNGGDVRRVGPVHGISDLMTLTPAGMESPLFAGLTVDNTIDGEVGYKVPVARYHSLGCTDVPEGLISLGTSESEVGPVTMAAISTDGKSLGFQFHPESVLTPAGPKIIVRAIEMLSTQT